MKLYKKDSKGKTRILDIYAKDGVLYQESGLLDGKLVTHSKACKPKNTGKSNATTEITQATAEALALIDKKLQEGYFTTIEEVISEEVIMPMLAKDYFKEQHKISSIEILNVQPKLDGIRAITFYNHANGTIEIKSRSNRKIETVTHLEDTLLTHLLKVSPTKSITLDGELYIHGNTFQENVKLVKNIPSKESEKIHYHIYDVISNDKFAIRNKELMALFSYNIPYINIVQTYASNKSFLEAHFTQAISQGYEGIMIRLPNSLYALNKRSSDLLKYKKFLDIALPIIDITPNDANPLHGTVWVEYKGQRTKTGAKLSHSEREELLSNKDYYIGKIAEIRYFEETDDGLLRFPIYLGERIDK